MKIVAFAPIKLKNERLAEKNIKKFSNGKPLCYYLLNTLVQVKEIDEVYVFCSDHSLQQYIPKSVRFLRRDILLDGNQAKGQEIALAFAQQIDADIFLMTHVTAPFLAAQTITDAISAITTEGHDSAFTVEKKQEFFWSNGRPLNYDLTNIPRTQDLVPLYQETTGLYAYERDIILKHKRRIGFSPKLLEISAIEAIDIDYPEDFMIADAINSFAMQNQTLPNLLATKHIDQ